MSHFIGNTFSQTQKMLETIGVKSMDEMFSAIGLNSRPKSFNLPEGKSEWDVFTSCEKLSLENSRDLILFLGGGYYDHYIPAAVSALISRGEFFTAYTPYQPECSQGTLQALFEYQSAICSLTGMDVANASLYDGGTALYEAMMMALRITGRNRIVMDGGVSPIYRTIVRSYTKNLNIEFVELPVKHGQSDRGAINKFLNDQTAAVLVQNPNFFGAIDDHSDIVGLAHGCGALAIESVYPISLGLLKSPGEMGVDIAVGDGQSLGLPLNFGGPYLGFLSTRRKYIRQMPGRIVGETVDCKGERAFVNTLQTREQHIRRQKATSNICTNVALCAVQSLIYMSLLGKEGLIELAQLNLDLSEFARQQIEKIKGVEVKRSSPTFNEFAISLPCSADLIVDQMIKKGFAPGFPLGRYYKDMSQYMIVAVTEKRSREEILAYAQALDEVVND